MRPIARQSARWASHIRATRIRQSYIPHYTQAQHRQLRAFNSSVQRSSDSKPPTGPYDIDELVRKQREEQEQRATKTEGNEDEDNKAKTSGNGVEGRKLNRRERKLALQNGHVPEVPKPPPIPEWLLRHNVRLTGDIMATIEPSEGKEVLNCIDSESGRVLFTVPYYSPPDSSVYVDVRGKGTNVSALDLEMDKVDLKGLPDNLREEMIIHHLQVQRAKRPDEVDQEALAELLVALPRDMQEEILRREAVEGKRKPGDKTADYENESDTEGTKYRRKIKMLLDSTSPIGQNFFDQKFSARPGTAGAAVDGHIRKTLLGPNPMSVSSDVSLITYSLLEAEMAARAGLSMAQAPQHSSSFAASRVDISLTCADSDSHNSLDNVVCDIAVSVGADVIRLDANDFEDLTNEYVGGDQDSPGSFSTLGYDVYDGYHSMSSAAHNRGLFGRPPSADDDDEFDMDEDDVDEDEAEDVDARPSDNGFGDIEDLRKALSDKRRQLGIDLSRMGVQVHVGIPQIIYGGSGRGQPGLPPGVMVMGPGSGRGPRRLSFGGRDEINYDEARLTALLEGLLEAPKERRSQGGHDELLEKVARVDIPEARTEAARMLVNYLRSDTDAMGANIKLETQPPHPTNSSSIDEVRQKTIIHIRDLKDIHRSNLGNAIITRLVRIAEKRRRSGEAVLVVGTSCQDRADSMFLGQPGDFPFRSITIPPLFQPFPPEIKELKERMEKENKETRGGGDEKILNINLRHLQSMLRRLRPNQPTQIGPRAVPHHMLVPLLNYARLSGKVLSLDQVHRLVLTAIGLAESHAKADEVQLMHIVFAAHVTGKAEQVVRAWERENRNPVPIPKPSQSSSKDGKEGSEPGRHGTGKSKVDELRRNCNQHETRLLTGVVDAKNIKTGFSDVHAAPDTIEALKTLTTLSLLRPEAFTYGVLAADRLPGLLLYGPPGTGKTLLAKAVAKESMATVLEISGAQIYEKYVGEGEKMVRAVFSLAKKLSPCVVFIDEADAIFGSRSSAGNRNTHREIVNQFLREWDGMDDHRVFIMVASNRPFDLDDAVLRRLPRRLLVDLPVVKDRESIMKIHLKSEMLDSSVDVAKLAERTPFYSGSDLKNLCVAAALACVREENELLSSATKNEEKEFKLPEKRTLSARHFEQAIKEISASISEDMSSLTAIRKFDEQYGDRKGRTRKKGYGFGMGEGEVDEMSVRVRPGDPGAAPP